jgi:O-antigen ligase
MRLVLSTLPWLTTFLAASGIIGMELVGGGGRPMFPLLACYVPVLLAALLSLPGILSNQSRLHSTGFPLMVITIAYLVIRTMVSGDQGLRSYEMLRLAGFFTVYAAISSCATDKGPRLLFILLICVVGFFQTIVELYQLFCDPAFQPIALYMPELKSYYARAVGTYANKNHLAWMIGDSALFLLALAFWGRFRWSIKGLLLYGCIGCSLGVFLSLSRGGLVAFIAGVTVFALLSLARLFLSGKNNALGVGVVVVALSGCLGAALTNLVQNNLNFATRIQGVWIDSYREDLWRAAAHDFGMAPFLGLGAGSFQWAARLMMPHESLLAHNDYAQLLSEYGLVGFLLVVTVLGVQLWLGVTRLVGASRPLEQGRGGHWFSDSQAILLGSIAVVVAQATHSFFDFNMHLGANALLAGVCLGILENPCLKRTSNPFSRRWLGPVKALLQAAMASLIAIVVFTNWKAELGFWTVDLANINRSLPNDRTEILRKIEAARFACESAPFSIRYATGLSDLLAWSGAERAISREEAMQLSCGALKQAMRGDRGDWYAPMLLGHNLAKLGDEDHANAFYVQAMQRLPLFALPYEEYAIFLHGVGLDDDSSHYARVSSRFQDAHLRAELNP